ncbi:MAG: c-type cytochrome [Planctomycetes bacterium]|nr:c-type cytochrome [Planctomycetota bacterium]
MFRMTAIIAGVVLLFAPLSTVQGQGSVPRSPAQIFAASCSTCHGSDGLGGHASWVDSRVVAPRIARGLGALNPLLEARYGGAIRNGSWRGSGFTQAMPAFGREVLSDAELDGLVAWLLYRPPLGGSSATTGVPAPPRPAGREILVEILDEAPWYRDDGTDLADPFADRRRVVLAAGEYMKVVNRGRTWHTLSNPSLGVDTGFLGYAGNIPGQDVGYAYLEATALASGAHKYFCSMHPYMQLEIATPGTLVEGLTEVSKIPIARPTARGIGELWVGLQTWANVGGAPNGAAEVFRGADWTSTLIPRVGNNPHNGWVGTARDPQGQIRRVAVFANWHDASVTVIDAERKVALGDIRVGAANAHVMTAPLIASASTGADRWFVTVMGSNKLQELDPFADLQAGFPTLPALSQYDGANGRPAFSPHGLWFLDDGRHLVTANTYSGSASLYDIAQPWSDPATGYGGIGCEVANALSGGTLPLASSVFAQLGRPSSDAVVYTNNAGTHDISVYRASLAPAAKSLTRLLVPPPLGNAAGNLALMQMPMNAPVRWAHMPIQCAVSPPDAKAHGRYMVVCNKASMNVSIVALDSQGMPNAVYTFPAGLGCHGVSFGRKAILDATSGLNGKRIAYFAYVTNTFQDYVSVYDLELLESLRKLEARGQAPAEFLAGGSRELVFVAGHAPMQLLGVSSIVVPITVFSPDARGLVHVGDLPLTLPAQPGPSCYLEEHVWIELPGMGMTPLRMNLRANTGAMGLVATPLPPPWRG